MKKHFQSLLKKLQNKLNTIIFFFKKKKIIVLCRAYYGDEWMEIALQNIEPFVHKIIILQSTRTWNETDNAPDDIAEIVARLKLKSDKYDLLIENWGDQWEQQNKALSLIKNKYKKFTHIMYVDTDEIYEPTEMIKLKKNIRSRKYFNKTLRVQMFTYIKSIYYRVSPIEPYKPIAIIPNLPYVEFTDIRYVEGCPIAVINVFMHHFSLVRKDENRIKQKLENIGIDSFNQVDNWYHRFYENFTTEIENFHTIKGQEQQWQKIEIVDSKELPHGVEQVYKSWNRNE